MPRPRRGGAWAVSRWGPVLDLLDRANHRSSHDGVVPKGGGIGILAAFVFSALAVGLPALFWVPGAFIALFSLYGDKADLSPKVRLPAQFVAALVLLSSMLFSDLWSVLPVQLNGVPFQGVQLGLPVLCLLFLSVFVVGTANYYNFMDGINGIGGITGVVAFGLIAVFGVVSGAHGSLIALSLCMGFACLGFLPFNMPNARVFMGDVGSVLLGFVFAGLAVGHVPQFH